MDRCCGSKGLLATSVHPGGIDTNLSRHLGPEFVLYIKSNEAMVRILKSLEQGAATTVVAAIGKGVEGVGK